MSRLAWHFLHSGGRLRTGELAPPDGEWLIHEGRVEPCVSGLHASERAIDALSYVPTEDKVVLCRVELRGTILEHGSPVDKLAASERRILWRLDGDTTDRTLREFARRSARQVLHLWQPPAVVVQYLETGGEKLRAAAGAAAWAAAEDAARDAAGYAAQAAARAAAGYAAWNAARAAAVAAAGAAAGDAAWAAAVAAAGDAARAAAGYAAQAAARAAAGYAAQAAARAAAGAAAQAAARAAQNIVLERLITTTAEEEA